MQKKKKNIEEFIQYHVLYCTEKNVNAIEKVCLLKPLTYCLVTHSLNPGPWTLPSPAKTQDWTRNVWIFSLMCSQRSCFSIKGRNCYSKVTARRFIVHTNISGSFQLLLMSLCGWKPASSESVIYWSVAFNGILSKVFIQLHLYFKYFKKLLLCVHF